MKRVIDRIRQMRERAKASGKFIPTVEAIEELFRELDAMKCPHCKRTMNLAFKDGRSTCVTLQHDRDGTIRLLCKGCNSRHHLHPGDTFYQVPLGQYRCIVCKDLKLPSEMQQGRGKPNSRCLPCGRKIALAYRNANLEQCRARDRAYKSTPEYKQRRREDMRRLRVERKAVQQ